MTNTSVRQLTLASVRRALPARQGVIAFVMLLCACSSGSAQGNIVAPPPPNDLAGCSATASIMSSSFESSQFSPFQPASGLETIIATGGYRGTHAVEGHFLAAGGDVSRGIVGTFSNQQVIYARWAYKQSATFNNTGIKKLFRFRDQGQNALMGTLGIHWGKFDWSWDGDSQTWWVESVTPDQLRGGWHWFEIMNDLSTPGTVKAKVWIDGQLVVDAVRTSFSYGGTQFGAVVFNGVFNGPVPDGTEWMDDAALSTSCIAAP